MTLTELRDCWEDVEAFHKTIHEHFTDLVNANPELCAHRDYVERNVWGFGERSFWWLWKIILEALPKNPKLIEIGVFRAATLSIWKIIRNDAEVFGVTPLDTSGGVWDSDYKSDIEKIHIDFNLQQPTLFVGSSQEKEVIKKAFYEYDLLYIDGLHTFIGCYEDLINYTPMVKSGGYMVLDDCNNDMHMPWGFFQGIQDVTDAKSKWISEFSNQWDFICSVVHISVFKKK